MEKQLASELLEKMMLIRKFEESVQYYFTLGMIHGTCHLCIGEEATAVGTCMALAPEDDMFATHRGHGAAIAKGIDVPHMMAEIFGRATGVCKGRGGSMHIADKDVGVLGANGIVGPSMALATGAALAHKMRGEKRVALAFFGDGATNEGGFHEAMNLASIWKLPVLFICTNNTYGMSTHISKVMADTDIEKRAIPFGIRAVTIDGNDVELVYETVKRARAKILAEPQPILIVENTYRISGHSKSDGNRYRTKEEINSWKEKDPIKLFSERMLEQEVLTKEEIDTLWEKADTAIKDAVYFATQSPYPKVEDLYDSVYAE